MPDPIRYSAELEGLTLRAPHALVAFGGWVDAGLGGTGGVRHLITNLNTRKVAEIDPEEFYSFTDTRPHVTFDEGGLRRIEWPANRFWAGEIPGTGRDLVVLEGIEPNLRWRTFGEHVAGVAQELGVGLVVTLGALLTDIPHTRPTSVIGTADSSALISRLDLRPSSYEGPTGIVGALHQSCHAAGLDSISLWASVPSYVPGSTSPKAALALLERIGELLDATVPITELEIATADYERQLDELVQDDEESSSYVAELERVFDEQAMHGDGSDLVDEVERFLRDR